MKAFAEKYGLRLKHNDRGQIVPCRMGMIYDWGDGQLAAMVIGSVTSIRKWNRIRRGLLKIGCSLLQDCDQEGTMTFDPANREQCRKVISVMGAKRAKKLSAEMREKLCARLVTALSIRQSLRKSRVQGLDSITETQVGL